MPTLDEVVDHLHGTRPVERVQSRQVLESVGPEALEDVAHTVGLELEQARGAPRREELERLRVVDGNRLGIEIDAGLRQRSIFTQLSMSVSVRSPRKSILRRPMRSIPFMSYCVVMSDVVPLKRGTKFTRGSGAITTPAACVDACRVVPSRRRETSTSSLTFGIACRRRP